MTAEYSRGSEWRRWDLHLHTKGTNKNDQFHSADFSTFCKTLFEKAIEHDIAAIGITDYFSIENYRKVVNYVAGLDGSNDFNEAEKAQIKDILLIPNVELRMLPVTDRGKLVNIHCLFNPAYLAHLENDFFSSIDYSDGVRTFKMNEDGLIGLGKALDLTLDNAAAYKKGVENFVVSHGSLQSLFAKNPSLAENTIVAVSNSNNDGASAFQKHYDFFENTDPGSLQALRKSIYYLSQFVFSGNDEDRKYFLGQKVDDEIVVKNKCGSLKPCIHGSDAHTEEKLFKPDDDRFCWIKADVTFEGLRQVIYEPADRVFIGAEPPVLERVRSNKTKYIDSLAVNQNSGYKEAQGVWFKNVHIDLNKELIAIIGNKGSGKSALSDILGIMGNTHNAGVRHENLSFLNAKTLKFRKRGYAENFNAELIWEDGSGKGSRVLLNKDVDIDEAERVKYLPQNYFENLTNDLDGEGFDQTLKSVIFLHLPEEQRLSTRAFSDLEDLKAQNTEMDLADLRKEAREISSEIIKLEAKKHLSYNKRIESAMQEKQKELDEHDKNKPKEVPDPAKSAGEAVDEKKQQKYVELKNLNDRSEELVRLIFAKRTELNQFTQDKEELSQLSESLNRLEGHLAAYKQDNREKLEKHGLNVDEVIKVILDKEPLSRKIKAKALQIGEVVKTLRTKESIDNDPSLINNPQGLKEAYEQSHIVEQANIAVKTSEIKKDLSKPEKDFQEYKEKLAKWERTRVEIEGSETRLNTLKFFKKEKEYLDKDLPKDLAARRSQRLTKTIEIFRKKKEIIELYKVFKKFIDDEIAKDQEFAQKFKMEIDVNFRLDPDFATMFLQYINRARKGTYLGATDKVVNELFIERDLLNEQDISDLLNTVIEHLESDQRETNEDLKSREISDQVDKVQEFYDFLFSLEYLVPIYELKLDGKILDELSPGEKGTLLLVFYLMIDKEDTPLVIDQPEDNLDNKSVFQVLTHFMKTAKKRRQIIIITHNPNLAVGADAEQIIYVELDKKDGKNVFSYETGSIENPTINARLVEVLEGTMPAFDKRKLRYKKTPKV